MLRAALCVQLAAAARHWHWHLGSARLALACRVLRQPGRVLGGGCASGVWHTAYRSAQRPAACTSLCQQDVVHQRLGHVERPHRRMAACVAHHVHTLGLEPSS